MNRSVDDLKTWYRSLRDQKVRLDKTKSGQAANNNVTEQQKCVKSTFEFIKPKSVVQQPVKSVSYFFLLLRNRYFVGNASLELLLKK